MAVSDPEALRAVGEGALLLEFGAASTATAALARGLATALLDERPPGLQEAVPAYRTLLLRFDPCVADAQALAERIRALLAGMARRATPSAGDQVELPVYYGGEYGRDLEDVARHTGLAPAEVVRLHSEAIYVVEFLGFSPGFPYLSGLPPALATPRLATPRSRVPAGSVAIGGTQTGFYPLASPGGWRLIGRVPALRFDPAHPETLPYRPGDRIRFVPVDPSSATFAAEDRARSSRARGHAERAEIDDDLAQPGRPGGTARIPGVPMPQAAGGPDRQDTSGMRALRVVRAGPLATVQDGGRFGLAALGYSAAGALDRHALEVANILVGNEPDVSALELTLDGGEFEAVGDLVIALAGADLAAEIDAEPLPPLRAASLRHGGRLRFVGRRSGMRAYLAVGGGIATPPVLGSRSTDLVAGIGGLAGRPLRAGDSLPVGPPPSEGGYRLPGARPRDAAPATVRVVWGPQDEWFTSAARATFADAGYAVTARSDRTGLRLSGPALRLASPRELSSEGVAPGAVQVPPDGTPIVLLADGRSVGGYPKIATVIGPDLALLAQAAPGDSIAFRPVSVEEARRAAFAARERLRALPLAPEPALKVRCLLEGRTRTVWRCPRTLACTVSGRCLWTDRTADGAD